MSESKRRTSKELQDEARVAFTNLAGFARKDVAATERIMKLLESMLETEAPAEVTVSGDLLRSLISGAAYLSILLENNNVAYEVSDDREALVHLEGMMRFSTIEACESMPPFELAMALYSAYLLPSMVCTVAGHLKMTELMDRLGESMDSAGVTRIEVHGSRKPRHRDKDKK